MDDRELYDALRTNEEMKQASIHLLPACGSADAMLEITHNLNQILEWNWRLVSAQKETISNGRVIAFTSRKAAEKINNQVAREVALAHGQSMEIRENAPQGAKEGASIYNLRSHLVLTDFSSQDTRLSLSVDNEKLTGRDAGDNMVFTVSMGDLLDVQLRKEWDHPLQLDAPIGLVSFLETATDPRDAMAATAVLAAYAGIGTVLAQVRTPVHILDIAWQDKGAVKTVSVQVPVHESGRLLRACVRLVPASRNSMRQPNHGRDFAEMNANAVAAERQIGPGKLPGPTGNEGENYEKPQSHHSLTWRSWPGPSVGISQRNNWTSSDDAACCGFICSSPCPRPAMVECSSRPRRRRSRLRSLRCDGWPA